MVRSVSLWTGLWVLSLSVGDESGSAPGPGPLRLGSCPGLHVWPERVWFIITHLSPANSRNTDSHVERLSVVCLLINGVNDRSVLHQHYSCALGPCCVCFGSAAIRAIVTRLNIVLPPASAVVSGRPSAANYTQLLEFKTFSDGGLFLRDEDERDADLYSHSWDKTHVLLEILNCLFLLKHLVDVSHSGSWMCLQCFHT